MMNTHPHGQAGTMEQIRWLAGRLSLVIQVNSRLGKRATQRLTATDGTHPAPLPLMLTRLFRELKLESVKSSRQLDVVELPAVCLLPGGELGLVHERSTSSEWLYETPSGKQRTKEWPAGSLFYPVKLAETRHFSQTAQGLFDQSFQEDRAWMVQAALASITASLLVLATSLYSMQVYDRVIGQGGVSTLIVLTVGVMVAILVEFLLKIARGRILDKANSRIDVACAQGVFAHLLRVRIDEFPASLGTLSAQVRGFESVRAFRSSLRIYLLTDAPFALLFLVVIYLLGGPVVASIPAIALVLALVTGWSFKRAVEKHSYRLDQAGNQRQGLLVEVIQAAESIKACGASWIALSRWNSLSKKTSEEASRIKALNETAGFTAALIQQVSYVGLVAAGAYLATTSQLLTIGSIIACSILSGRVLTPILQVPGLLVQWANARVALTSLEKLFELETDQNVQAQSLQPEAIAGKLSLSQVEFAFRGQAEPMNFAGLIVNPGERVAILGNIGSGKSTLLKLLAGLLKPQRGRVLLDGIDIHQIDVERRAEVIGYLPQSTRLIGGTLRENLCLGVQHYSDEQILGACRLSGLSHLVSSRTEGLDLRIPEGGEGLSGGQKQLVALTRVILASPRVWLLDEPTASFDDTTEARAIEALRSAIKSDNTLILVTHKLSMLELVDRIVILTPRGILMDGPRQVVLERLNAASTAAQPAQKPPVTGPFCDSPTGPLRRQKRPVVKGARYD